MGILRIDKMDLKDFRIFKDISFNLGKYITVIAGHNATGKSTLLGLLGHCAELKIKDGRPILKKQFRTEFSEIIKASNIFDKKSSNIYSLYFSDDHEAIKEGPISYRTTWQEDGERFRIIPKRTRLRNTEKKIKWPTLYLGLSRLYPIGESLEARTSSIKLNEEQKSTFFREYKKILSLNEDPIDCSAITIQETSNKKTIGIRTDTYDEICNSAGQDNLGQILLAVMSFEALKEERGEQWNGGMLLIDEIDATIHPAAQNKLVKYLFVSAKRLDLQIVFTTHSLSLLDYVCYRTLNNTIGINNYEILYLTTSNGILRQIKNPSFDDIYNDMMITMSTLTYEKRKITVYSEDKEARWFLQKLIGKDFHRLDVARIQMGHEELFKLLEGDPKHYRNILFVVDGDVGENKINEINRTLPNRKNIIKLPGGKSPEEVFLHYLKNLPPDSEALTELSATGFSQRVLSEHGPDSSSQGARRERNKKWFWDFIQIIEDVYQYWEKDNKDTVEDFTGVFKESFNNIATRVNLPRIT
jgi:AAA15 family ATPase/GTPase